MSKLNELKAQFEAAKKRMQDEGKAALREAMTELFEKHPKMQAIRWTQYTPYFNDGQPCVFSVNEPCMKHDDLDADGGDYEDGFHSWYGGDDISADAKACSKAMESMFAGVPDELLQATFGDHCQVTANRRGFTVDEYEHE